MVGNYSFTFFFPTTNFMKFIIITLFLNHYYFYFIRIKLTVDHFFPFFFVMKMILIRHWGLNLNINSTLDLASMTHSNFISLSKTLKHYVIFVKKKSCYLFLLLFLLLKSLSHIEEIIIKINVTQLT
jgi:hypothetical protein